MNMKVYYKRLPVNDMSIRFAFKSEYDSSWKEGVITQKELMEAEEGCVECLIEKVAEKTYKERIELEDMT